MKSHRDLNDHSFSTPVGRVDDDEQNVVGWRGLARVVRVPVVFISCCFYTDLASCYIYNPHLICFSLLPIVKAIVYAFCYCQWLIRDVLK